MADDIAALKQLQVGLNAAFESLFLIAETDPKNVKALAAASDQFVGLSHATAAAALGPAFSLIGLSATPANYMAIRIAIDLNLFEINASHKEPTTLDELVKSTEADPTLIKRIIRLISALGFVKQIDVIRWEPTPLTHAINIPPLKSWMIAHFDQRMEVYGRFPAWLKKNKMEDELDGRRQHFPGNADAVTLVDVGGGAGQAIGTIKRNYPDVPGKFILQDLPKTIEGVTPGCAQEIGFESMIHNFFEPKPIKGAKYYLLRRVLHDWNDEQSCKILQAMRPALDKEYSRLLIHDFVLPDVNAGPVESVLDLMMITCCDGKERTELDWHALLDKAGFKIVKFWRAEVGRIAVIEAVVV